MISPRNYAHLLFASLVALAGATPLQARAAESRGKLVHGLCVSCHGDHGQGNPEIQAPAIAGLPDWYITAQLEKFRNGLRGKHPADPAGTRMRAMSRTLKPDDLAEVAKFVSALPPTAPTATVPGDAARGKTLFATCLACHGPDGKGNAAMKAPPLAGGNDWYLVAQLKKFRSGQRGQAGDATGSMMTPMAKALPDDQAVADVIAYVQAELRR